MLLEEVKKLKVAELREELKTRGLEAKGNKAQLVKRLENALKKDAGESVDDSVNESMNTSSYDSTLDHSGSQEVEQAKEAIEIIDDDDEPAPAPVVPVQLIQAQEPVIIGDDPAEECTPVGQAPLEEPITIVEPEPVAVETPGLAWRQWDAPVEQKDIPVEAPVEQKDIPVEAPVEQKPVPVETPVEQNPATEARAEETHVEPQVVQEAVDTEEPVQMTSEAVEMVEPVKEEQQVTEKPKEEPVVEMEIKEDVAKEEAEKPTEETTEGEQKMETESVPKLEENGEPGGPEGELFQVMDSVGEVDAVIPVVENDDDRSNRKRHRSRSRSPHRRHRSRHSRSRSPRRRSRSSERHRRSGSKERHRRSGSRDRYGRERGRDSYMSRKDPEEPEDWIEATNVRFDKFNCDLHIRIKEDGYKCNPITVEGFAFMWAGVRSNFGVTKGKVAYECKILEHLNVDHLPEEEKTRHVVRVGFSTDDTSMQLGEEKHSYGYGGTGKASTECKFKDFGETFAEGDIIGVYLDMDAEPMTISYSKNGADLGTCFEIEKADLEEKALFPHVLTKNSEFEVNFGQMETAFHELKESYAFINDIPEAERVRGTKPPAKKEDCEMVMMCGLPGAGKTYWATKYAQEHGDQRFNVLGTNNIIDKMKVMGLPRKGNYSGRWDVLIDKSTKCLTRLLEIASKKKRNYILDQTNVYPTAQRRKMRPFEGFQRRAVVIVPTDEVFKERVEKREKEEGKEVPDNAVWEMKANFQLPEEGQCFDKVEFVELQREEAQTLVETYNKEGIENLPPDYKRFRGADRYADRDRTRGYGGKYGDSSYGSKDKYHTDHRSGGGGGSSRGSRGSYMGYSSSDRQRADRYSDRDSGSGHRDRYSRDDRSAGRSYGSSYSSGSGYNNNYSSGAGSGGWGGQSQSGWGGQSQGWGNQGWGNQGWGSQGYGSGQWTGYNQQPQSGSQGWGNQGYYGNWGNYYGNQQGWGGYGGGSGTQ